MSTFLKGLQDSIHKNIKPWSDSCLKEVMFQTLTTWFSLHCTNITAIFPCNEPLWTARLSNAKWALHPFPEEMVIKSCIMHVHYNDTHNEYRGMALCGGQIMAEMRLEFSQWGHHGDNNVAGTARIVDQFKLAVGWLTFIPQTDKTQRAQGWREGEIIMWGLKPVHKQSNSTRPTRRLTREMLQTVGVWWARNQNWSRMCRDQKYMIFWEHLKVLIMKSTWEEHTWRQRFVFELKERKQLRWASTCKPNQTRHVQKSQTKQIHVSLLL